MSKRRGYRTKKRVQYYSPKRRAIYAEGDSIDHLTLFELHGWTCWVCKDEIDRNLRKPNCMAATVEHIIPLSKGGTHTWDNVAPSHAKCNFDRGNTCDDSLLNELQGIITV